MTAIRWLMTLSLIAAAAGAIYACSYMPMMCEIKSTAIEKRTLRIIDASDRVRTAPIARANVATLQRCLDRDPRQVNTYMILAVNLRLLGENAEAAKMYETALRYDRRPELYLNLGTVQLALGNRDAAIESLVRARVFNQFVDSELPPEVREEVRRRAKAIAPDRR